MNVLNLASWLLPGLPELTDSWKSGKETTRQYHRHQQSNKGYASKLMVVSINQRHTKRYRAGIKHCKINKQKLSRIAEAGQRPCSPAANNSVTSTA
jgi:hypothetical protein